MAAGRLVDQPLEERLRAGGDLIEGVAEEAAKGEGEAAGSGDTDIGGQVGATREEVADGVQLFGSGQVGRSDDSGRIQGRRGAGAFSDDDSAGGEVAQSLVFSTKE